MSSHPLRGFELSTCSSTDDEVEVYTSRGPRGSRFVTFEVTYEDIVWMEPKRFVTKRDVSFAGLCQRVATAFPRTLRPGAPLGDSMGSTYGANFVVSANVADRGGGTARLIIDSDVALRVALDAVQPPNWMPEVYKIRCAVMKLRK